MPSTQLLNLPSHNSMDMGDASIERGNCSRTTLAPLSRGGAISPAIPS